MRRKVRPSRVETARLKLRTLEQLPNYQSLSPTYATPNLQALEASFDAAHHNTEQVEAAIERLNVDRVCALDAEDAAGQLFCEAVTIASSHAMAQYGNDSYVMNAFGRKRKSEYRRPGPKVDVE